MLRNRGVTAIFLSVAAAFLMVFGCSDNNKTNPLIGWKCLGTIGLNNYPSSGPLPPLDKAIIDDYKDFIKQLPTYKSTFGPRSESSDILSISFFEDRIGQHAVEIFMPLRGTYLYYVLVYDKSNKKLKIIKYSAGHYAC